MKKKLREVKREISLYISINKSYIMKFYFTGYYCITSLKIFYSYIYLNDFNINLLILTLLYINIFFI